MVVTIKVASVGSRIRVEAAKYGSEVDVHPWNVEEQEIRAIETNNLYIIFSEERNIHILLAVHIVEKVTRILLNLLLFDVTQEEVAVLLNPEDDDSTTVVNTRSVASNLGIIIYFGILTFFP